MQIVLKNDFIKFSKNKLARGLVNLFTYLLQKKNKSFDSVCDIGCGSGFWSYVGLNSGLFKEVIGCDVVYTYQVDELNQIGQAAYKEINNSPYLPFQDNYFDLVFSMDVIEHVQEDLAFFAEHIRIAKNQGLILICTPNKYRPMNLIRNTIGKLKYPYKLNDAYYGECIHIREYSKKNLEKLISNFSHLVEYKIIPYWIGIGPIGMAFTPKILENNCHYWICLIRKK